CYCPHKIIHSHVRNSMSQHYRRAPSRLCIILLYLSRIFKINLLIYYLIVIIKCDCSEMSPEI
ncbi:hypothetical protein L9F63_011215, partial [Diploptera punctata]